MKTIFRFFTGILIFLSLTIGRDIFVQSVGESLSLFNNSQTSYHNAAATMNSADEMLAYNEQLDLSEDMNDL